MVQWFTLSPHRKKFVGSIPKQASSHVLSWYSIFLLQSKDVHFRLIGIPELSVGVSVDGLFMLAMLKLSICPGCTLTSCRDSWHRLQHPRKLECRISGNRGWDGWMNLILQHCHLFFILTEEKGSWCIFGKSHVNLETFVNKRLCLCMFVPLYTAETYDNGFISEISPRWSRLIPLHWTSSETPALISSSLGAIMPESVRMLRKQTKNERNQMETWSRRTVWAC